jgi:protein phosphatase
VRLCADEGDFRRRGHLFVVADGMGGHAVGELASKLAVETVPHTFFKRKEGDAPEALEAAIREANETIHQRGVQNRDFQRMGTTCTALALSSRGAIVGHVGDSRVYRIRRDQIDQLTFDHSLQWELRRQKKQLPEELKLLDNRNIIVRSLGPERDVEVDLEGPHAVLPGDVYLLCSDGLTGHVSDAEIGGIARELSPAQACRLLVHLANLRGGADNCTVIVAQVGELPMNVLPPAQDDLDEPAAPLGWWWLAGFWLAGVFLVGGLSLILFRRWMEGVVVTALAGSGMAFLLVGAWSAARRTARQHRSPAGGSDRGPHRSGVAMSSAGLVEVLSRLEFDLRRAAQEEGWSVDWAAHEAAVTAAAEAVAQKRYGRGVRDFGRAIDVLMSDLPQRRAAGVTRAPGSVAGRS